ncbi:hypothetical protein URH17368_2165 [Alicyclobacillus hesperidum URH17-3-68]|uniref:Uncharacterized protein n=1 Tax=Alicyclobacillus hesperidum TaxID=89784 RepID=A0A1H2XSZ9_9BACL|nr:hypothetical protein [Alicyclobacillus hesperidum]KRW90904.1 hypothetical protein SD51_12070 [Alicyclobacillus tengchongensis]EJY55010.1 hypothetical protein URH17368_2165 [Alicyclobacillus hesperidum URH17-3-68]SDW95925.1 hypothetical protein SAMN04489725_1246 [Alicyclobacillus hesperidum]GLG00817.1 hypothetical protein Alches_08560 [Alicyclobacillus hesperidum subsp. aegles]GLV12618.1 hypothetical protein Heshes_03020 [Alicyclobacillus hesperidum]
MTDTNRAHGTPVPDGNQAHGSELFLDSVFDGIDRLQQDGGVAPEIAHRPQDEVEVPPPAIARRRIGPDV